jgi:hypothetical protein
MPSDPTGIVSAKGDASTTLATETAPGSMSFAEALNASEPEDVSFCLGTALA